MTIISANIIADSISIFDDRITTLLIKCPYDSILSLFEYPIFHNSLIHENNNELDLLVTSTNWWDNFLAQDNNHSELISQIRQALNKSNPEIKREGQWHLPFIQCDEDPIDYTISYRLDNAQLSLDQAKKCSVARCLNIWSPEKNLIENDIHLCIHNRCKIALQNIARPLSIQEVNDHIELTNFIKKRKIYCNKITNNGWVTYRQELEMA